MGTHQLKDYNKFQTTHQKINLQVVQCYAPTNDADDEVKELFYNPLYHTLESKKAKDIVILMGDMNAKIGGNNNGYELITGREGLGTMNENGERFAVCADKMQTTQRRKSQIQHTALSGYRYLRTLTSHTTQPVPCTERSAKVEDRWTSLKTIWKDKEVVGRRKGNGKPWLSMETFKKVGERRDKKEVLNGSNTRATKAIAQKEYKAANKEVKKSVRRDKKKFIEDLAQQAEEPAGKNCP